MSEDSLRCDSQIAPASALSAITAAVAGLQYGQVTVIVHDGQVVQIERTERQRLALTESRPRNAEQLDRDR